MRHINQCFTSEIAKICQQAMSLESLNESIIEFLPQECKAYCKVSSFNKGHLILKVSDPIWLTPLRFLIPSLRDNLRREARIYQLATITIQVAYPEIDSKKLIEKTILSVTNKEAIILASEKCSYLPLKKALKHLAR